MQNPMRIARIVLLLFATAVLANAQGTRTWEQSKFDDFEKGTTKGVAIRSDGSLELAPSFRAVATTPSTYIWSVASDDAGNVFAAAGAPSRVYRIASNGAVTTVLAPTELQVQALVVDKSGTIYAATSPDGKIYRIDRMASGAKAAPTTQATPTGEDKSAKPALDPAYTSSLFFDPHTKYVWALALDADSRLYVATGDRGEIYRVNRDGSSSLFFKSDDAHIRAIAFDPKGNLIAGSDGSGLIYRIAPNGEGFVLYSAPKKEITALAIDSQGYIYASAAGEKRAAQPQPGVQPMPQQPVPQPPQPGAAPLPFAQIPLPGLGATGSEIYRIAPDGSPKRVWSSREDLVYSLAFDGAGHLLAGTGNKGRIYSVEPNGMFSDLLKASANQVIGFARGPKGSLYAATSNLGKLFVIEEGAEREGSYESDVFDARIFSRWGRAEVRDKGNVELFARSGNVDNPDRNWSPWKKVDLQKDPLLDIPAARYMQWRAVLHSGNPAPVVDSVRVNYLAKNVAPEVDDVLVAVGNKFQGTPRSSNDVTMAAATGVRMENIPGTVRDRDSVAVSWRAHDENDDQLSYSLYYRGDNESQWKLLKDDLGDRFYSFESGLLPDGGYTIRVIATDAPSHAPDDALTGMRESARFEVDSTPPRVENLAATQDGEDLHITFSANDTFSPIRRAEFSIDAGDWQFVAPVGLISDARVENYDVTVPLPRPRQSDPGDIDTTTGKPTRKNAAPADEHVVVVRVFDRYDNMSSSKVVVQRPRTK